VWAQELLEVQERDLRIRRWVKKIAELVVKNKHAAVVRVLKTLFSDVVVNRTSDERSGDELSFFDTEKFTELWGDSLFAVESVVLRTRRSLGSVWIVLLRLDLTNDLGQRLDVRTERRDFRENSFKRHLVYVLLRYHIFKLVVLILICDVIITWTRMNTQLGS